MRVSFISELEVIGYGRTYAVHRLQEKLQEKGITVTRNNDFKNADIIHAHSPLHIAHYVVNKYKNKKVVGTIHSCPDGYDNSYSKTIDITVPAWKFYKNFYSKFDKLIAPTEFVEKAMAKNGFENITVISSGVDLDTMRPNKNLADKFKGKTGLKNFIFLTGRIDDCRKNIITGIEAAKELDYEFAHAGDILPLFPASYIKKYIRKITAPENFHFLGYLTQEEMIGAYNSAKVFLQCSSFETEGLVVLEALGCGSTILAKRLPVYKGLLEDKENCLFYRNSSELKEKLVELMETPKLRKKLSQNGLESAKKRDISKTTDRYIKIYEDLLNKNT